MTPMVATSATTAVRIVIVSSLATLFVLDVRSLDDWPPLLDLGLVVGAEGFRCLLIARRHLVALVGEPLLHGGIGQRLRHRGIEPGDDVPGLGVPLVVHMPCQSEMARPGTPISSAVGTSGAAHPPRLDLAAIHLMPAVRTCASVFAAMSHMKSICPATRSCIAGAPPR